MTGPALGSMPKPATLNADSLRLAPFMTQLRASERDLDIEAVRERAKDGAFEPLPGGKDPAYGYTDDVLWLHGQVRLPADAGLTDYRLRFGYSFIDDVTFYAFRGDRLLQRQQAGSRTPRAEWPMLARQPVFTLSVAEPGIYDFFLRVETRDSLNAPVTLWQADTLAEQQVREALVFSLFYGILLAMALYNSGIYFATRDRNYLFYVLMLLSMVAYVSSLHGYAGKYLWPQLGDWSAFLEAIAAACAGAMVHQFSRSFLDLRERLPGYNLILVAGQLIWASTPILFIVLGYRFCLGVQTLMVLVTTLSVSLAGLVSLWQGVRRARFFLAAWLVLLIGSILFGMKQFGWLPGNAITRNAMQVGSALEVVLLAFALADRMHLEEGRRARLLRQARERLEQRVRERTQQLQRALAELTEKNAHLEQLNQIDGLTGIYNRRGLDEMIAREWARLLERPQPLMLIMFDLDGFKAINDQWGHPFGDHVLEEVIRRAKSALYRDTDCIARYGGEEFVVLLINTGEDDGRVVAERLREAVASACISNGQGQVWVTISVGQYTVEPERLHRIGDWHTVIECADRALYRAKSAGGNRVAHA